MVALFDWRSGRQKSSDEAEEEEIQALMSQVSLRSDLPLLGALRLKLFLHEACT